MNDLVRIYQATRITLRNTAILPVGFFVLEILQYLGDMIPNYFLFYEKNK
jgi:hypothetical protein